MSRSLHGPFITSGALAAAGLPLERTWQPPGSPRRTARLNVWRIDSRNFSPPQISFLFIFSIAKHGEKEPLYTLSGSQAVLATDVSRIHFGEV